MTAMSSSMRCQVQSDNRAIRHTCLEHTEDFWPGDTYLSPSTDEVYVFVGTYHWEVIPNAK